MNIQLLDSENNPINELTQWDNNRKLKITGLEFKKTPMIHFYNSMSARALVVQPQLVLSDLIVNVPNILLQQDLPINFAIFVELEGNEGKTTIIEQILVRTKTKPEDYNYEENIDYTSWVELNKQAKQQLIEMQNIINETQEKLDSGAFVGEKGQPGKNGIDGKPGEKGQPGENGVTPTIGTNGNWFLGAEDTGKPSRGIQGEQGKQGVQGQPGKDGKNGKDADMSQIYTKTEIDNKIGNINTVLSTLTNVGGA